MKSRKKVSRKKTARASRKTSVRRNSGRRSFRNRNKSRRGGMMRSARAVVGTLVYHDILPLFEASRFINNVGYDPKPDDGSITKAYKRFYRTFADIPVDDGIKESIRNLREELNDPVKNADKIKSIYDAIMKKLEEEKKKQLANPSQGLMVVGKSLQLPRSIGFVSDPGDRAGVRSGVSLSKSDLIQQFGRQPFSSPNLNGNPTRSTQKGTPAKLLTKSELGRRNQGEVEVEDEVDDNDNDKDEMKTPSKILFGTETPMTSPQFRSPPPPYERRTQENRNPQLPSSPNTIQRTLNFTTNNNDE